MLNTAIAVLLLTGMFDSAAAPAFDFASHAARARFARAQDAIGGSKALGAVRSLEIQGNERLRILFPRYYRIDSRGSVLFDGTKIVSVGTDGIILSDSGQQSNREEIARRGWANLAMYSIRYLLRPVEGVRYTVAARDDVSFGAMSGPALTFTRAGHAPIIVVLDAKTYRPLGFATPYTGTADEPGGYAVQALSDFRQSGGVWLPHQAHSRRFTTGGQLLREFPPTVYKAITVNSDVTPADFSVGRGPHRERLGEGRNR